MKTVGAVLILLGAMGGYARYRQQRMLFLRLGRALVNDLAVLKREICVCRRTLPGILEQDLCRGAGAEYLWKNLSILMVDRTRGLENCWIMAARELPERLSERLVSLGPLLREGGETLGRAIDEAREELLEDLRGEERRNASSMRLAGAAFISGACFLILVLM